MQKYAGRKFNRVYKMQTQDFEELAGRIQALADVLCGVISELDKQGVIAQPRIADNIECLARTRQTQVGQDALRRTLQGLADVLRAEYAAR